MAAQPLPKVTDSSLFQTIVSAYEDRSPHWRLLAFRIQRITQDCLAWNARYEKNEISKEDLRQQMIGFIVPQFFSIRQEARQAKNFYADYRKSFVAGLKIVTQPHTQTLAYSRQYNRTLYLTCDLVKHANTFIATEICAPLDRAKNAFETSLYLIEISTSWVGKIRQYTPTWLGGTWPRINKILDEYQKNHAAQLLAAPNTDLVYAQSSERSDPLLEWEAIGALEQVAKRIEYLLLSPTPQQEQ